MEVTCMKTMKLWEIIAAAVAAAAAICGAVLASVAVYRYYDNQY